MSFSVTPSACFSELEFLGKIRTQWLVLDLVAKKIEARPNSLRPLSVLSYQELTFHCIPDGQLNINLANTESNAIQELGRKGDFLKVKRIMPRGGHIQHGACQAEPFATWIPVPFSVPP